MDIPQKESDALRIATLLATVMVVLRHSFNLHLYYPNGNPWMKVSDASIFVQCFMASLTDVAIPAFFLISGFLFCHGMSSWRECLLKWRKRIKSLLLPYLGWNLLGLGVFGGLYFLPSLHEQIIRSFNWEWSWDFFISRMTYAPMVGQFWYIRTLMLFLLCVPLLLPILQSPCLSLIALVALVRLWLPIDTGLLSTEGFLFFFIGCWIGVNWRLPSAEAPRHWLWLIPLLAIRLVSPLCGQQLLPLSIGVTSELYVGWQVCLLLADHERVCKALKHWNQHSFFIYALHAHIVSGSALLLSRRIPHTPLTCFIAYIGCFVVTVALSVSISMIARRCLPKSYALLSGGR